MKNFKEVKEQKKVFKAFEKLLESKVDRNKTEFKKERASLRKIRGEKKDSKWKRDGRK